MKNFWKNSLLITIAILLIGGSFVFVNYKNEHDKEEYIAKELTISNDLNESPQEVDTDGDGSKDWEEILVGTNPNDAKSKPSPTKSPTTADITKNKDSEKLEPIDLVSREFFARYMELRQIGASKDKLNQQDLAVKTAGNIILETPVKYKIEIVLTKPDNGNTGVQQYGDEIGAIFKKNAVQARNEAVIARDSVQKEDPELLKEIDPSIASYKKTISELLKLRVPQTVAPLHLDLINGMNDFLFLAQSFRNSGVDPIKGLQAVAYYPVASKNFSDAVIAIKSYFKYLGIYENIF